MENVKRIILDKLSAGELSKEEAVAAFAQLSDSRPADPQTETAPVAIVGMACRLPMSQDVDSYWDNLVNNRNCFIAKPADKLIEDRVFENPHYAEFYDRALHTPEMEDLERWVGPYLEDTDKFDANFFGISEAEAGTMDPQHRIFLEQAFRALEDAGYSESEIKGSRTGCFVGRDGTNSNFYRHMVGPESSYHGGIWEGILASRINYHFDLRGPSFVVDTACSSSLVAVQMAMNALKTGDCTMAIAGGAALTCAAGDMDEIDIDEIMARDAEPGAVSSRDNRVRSFDAKASGAVFGEGVSVLILKTLDAAERDGNQIYGLVSAVATNSDGASNGLTAPNPRAQGEVIRAAWKRAGVDGAEVDYIETHGTGTPLGDPIEVLGLSNAFAEVTTKKQFCGIGSVKSNIGHTVGAAGVAGIIKVVKAMNEELVPASVNFQEPNPHIDFFSSPVYVVDRNQPWPRRERPRIAGVSSFGFSGTNAHVVLSEYQAPLRDFDAQSRPYIFTVSAKTASAFASYLDKYSRFFAKDLKIADDDIFFTSTCGRGHYNHRLAIVASSIKELRTKFFQAKQSGWTTNVAQGVFVAEHKVVSDRKTELESIEIRENELYRLNRTTRDRIADFEGFDNIASVALLREVARNYTMGAEVDFSALVSPAARRASLPTYPFDRTHHWGVPRATEIEVVTETRSTGGSVGAKLLEECLVDTKDLAVFAGRLSRQRQSVIADHVIMGSHFIAGTVHIELMAEAMRYRLGHGQIDFQEIEFLAPATAPEDRDLEVQVILKDEGPVSVIEVLSRDENLQEWTTHARAKAGANICSPVTDNPTLSEVLADPELQPEAVSELTEFGPSWFNLEGLYSSATDTETSYGVINLSPEYRSDLKEFELHPALMDNAISVVPFMYYLRPNVYLPLMYKGLKTFKPLPAKFFVRTRRLPGRIRDVMSFQTTVIDEDGSTIATVDQFSMKRVSELKDFVSGSYYELGYQRLGEVTTASQPTGQVVAIGHESTLISALEGRLGDQLFRITFGDQRQMISDRHICVEPTKEGVTYALDTLGITDPERIIDLDAFAPQRSTSPVEDHTRTLKAGIHGFSAVVTSLLERTRDNVHISVLADYAHQVTGEEKYVDAANAAKLAMISSLRHECLNFKFTGIDVDEETSAEALVEECLATIDDRFYVALRRGQRFEPVLEQVRVDEKPAHSLDLYEDGYYLITGGLGALGAAIASGLSRWSETPINLVLTSRRSLPPRKEWAGIREADPSGRLAKIFENIEDAQNRGVTIELLPIDVADAESLWSALDEMSEKFGTLRGVVHAAGIAGDGFLFTKSMEEFDEVLAPKVEGLRNIVSYIGDDHIDFLTSFSSMTALIGGPGQADYSAANAYLDALSCQLRSEGVNAKSINWPGWAEIGMAHEAGLSDMPTIFQSVSTMSGIAAFNEVQTREVTAVVPGKINFDVVAEIGERFFPFRFSPSLTRAIEREATRRSAVPVDDDGGASEPDAGDTTVSLTGKPAEKFTQLEIHVAHAYANVLGLEVIDFFDSFTALGGNSMSATRLMKALNAEFGDILNISDMFNYATPDEMAEHIGMLQATESAADDVAHSNSHGRGATDNDSTLADMIDKLERDDVDAETVREFLKE